MVTDLVEVVPSRSLQAKPETGGHSVSCLENNIDQDKAISGFGMEIITYLKTKFTSSVLSK